MKSLLAFAALLQVGLGGHVAVRMPYLNPAGVTYVTGYQQDVAPLTYATGSGLQHVAAPLQYATAPLQYATAPLVSAVPAKVEAHHVGYATAQVPAVAAVPYVKHVPTVSHVPVTRIEAQPAFIEKQLDVAKPAVSTRKFQVRRPAIQKQFYDIEERVIVRPAGSALVELDEPTSKEQKGPAVIQPVAHATHFVHPYVHAQGVYAQAPVAPLLSYPVQPTASPLVPSSTQEPATPAPAEEESVVVDNADFRAASTQNQQNDENNQEQAPAARLSENPKPEPQVVAHSNGVPLETIARFAAHDPSPAVVPSQRNSPDENKSNQQRLIDLLTARGGVAEVGFSRSGSLGAIGDAGQVRARVLSATPAPDDAEPTGEHVSTRRIVVSRPIETLQEVDVVEPATKLERVSVQQPTLIKTAHLDHVQVHGSVPVIGKALAPAVAHATVPVYQKTISPAYQYYH